MRRSKRETSNKNIWNNFPQAILQRYISQLNVVLEYEDDESKRSSLSQTLLQLLTTLQCLLWLT